MRKSRRRSRRRIPQHSIFNNLRGLRRPRPLRWSAPHPTARAPTPLRWPFGSVSLRRTVRASPGDARRLAAGRTLDPWLALLACGCRARLRSMRHILTQDGALQDKDGLASVRIRNAGGWNRRSSYSSRTYRELLSEKRAEETRRFQSSIIREVMGYQRRDPEGGHGVLHQLDQ